MNTFHQPLSSLFSSVQFVSVCLFCKQIEPVKWKRKFEFKWKFSLMSVLKSCMQMHRTEPDFGKLWQAGSWRTAETRFLSPFKANLRRRSDQRCWFCQKLSVWVFDKSRKEKKTWSQLTVGKLKTFRLSHPHTQFCCWAGSGSGWNFHQIYRPPDLPAEME